MKAELTLITPEVASEMLKKNIDNRRLRLWWANALASAIKRGEWIPTHQGVAFSESGRLIDGQHRLMAVVLSKIPVQMFVFTGLSDDAYKVLDIGTKRSIGDTTGLEKKTAEACRFAGQVFFGGSVTPQQVMQVAESGLAAVHQKLLSYASSNSAVYTSAPMRVGACAMVLDGRSEEQVFSLYRMFATQNLQDLPPVGFALVRQVGTGKLTATSGGSLDLLARALKVYNPDNKELTKIQVGDSDGAAASAYLKDIIKRNLKG